MDPQILSPLVPIWIKNESEKHDIKSSVVLQKKNTPNIIINYIEIMLTLVSFDEIELAPLAPKGIKPVL